MTVKAADLPKAALALEESDRASLAGALIESLEARAEPEAVAAWEATIRRRVEELEAGSVIPVGWSEVRERLFRGYE